MAALGPGVGAPAIGTRVGVPWLGWTCGHCPYCVSERENLCDDARFTGYELNGGYAQYAVADARYVFPLPARYDDEINLTVVAELLYFFDARSGMTLRG